MGMYFNLKFRTALIFLKERNMLALLFFKFNFSAKRQGTWDLSFLTRGGTCAPCIGSVEYYPLD